MEADVRENVTAVVESYETQSLPDGQRDTRFSIRDEQFVAAGWHPDKHIAAGSSVGTNFDISLRTRSVKRKSSQRIPTSGKECFAQRDIAAIKRLRQPDPQACRPDNMM